MMTDQKGQSLIETFYVGLFLLMIMGLLFSFFYIMYARSLFSFHSYRAFLCLQELEAESSECEKKLKRVLQSQLFFSTDVKVNIQENDSFQFTVLKMSFAKKHLKWKRRIEVETL